MDEGWEEAGRRLMRYKSCKIASTVGRINKRSESVDHAERI